MAKLTNKTGLASFSSLTSPQPTEQIVELEPSPIILDPPWRRQRYISKYRLHILEKSIAIEGQRDAICLRKNREGKLELVYGKHRLLVCLKLGIKVKVIIRDYTIEQAQDACAFENIDRVNLSKLEYVDEVLAYLCRKTQLVTSEVTKLTRKIVKKQKTKGQGKDILTLLEAYERVGKVKLSTFVNDYLCLLRMPSDMLEVSREGALEFSKVTAIKEVPEELLRTRLVALSSEEDSPYTVAVLESIRKASKKNLELAKGVTEAFALGQITKETLVALCKEGDSDKAIAILEKIIKGELSDEIGEVKNALKPEPLPKAVLGLRQDCDRIFKAIVTEKILQNKSKQKKLSELLIQMEELLNE